MRIQSPKTPRQRKANAFENWAVPEIAAHYRRLCRNKRVAEVIRTLKRRGMTDWHAEILLRNVASIPQDWRSENEPWKQAQKRRNRLGKKLHNLAKEISSDPDLGGWCFQISAEHMHAPPELRHGMRTIAGLLEEAAVFLEPHDKPLIKISNGEFLSPAEFQRRTRPARKVPFTSYALLAIFELLRVYIQPAANERLEPRALNKETEILTSVLLKEQITPGTVTQLRKKTRRRYAREK
jgi:hypothetical protein